PAVLGLSVAGLQLGRFRCSLPNTSPWTCSRSRLLWMCPHWAVLLVVGTPAICQRGGFSIWWGHHRIRDVAATPAQGHQEIDARRLERRLNGRERGRVCGRAAGSLEAIHGGVADDRTPGELLARPTEQA